MKKEINDLILEDCIHECPRFEIGDNLDRTAVAFINPDSNVAIALNISQCKEIIAKLQEIIEKYEV